MDATAAPSSEETNPVPSGKVWIVLFWIYLTYIALSIPFDLVHLLKDPVYNLPQLIGILSKLVLLIGAIGRRRWVRLFWPTITILSAVALLIMNQWMCRRQWYMTPIAVAPPVIVLWACTRKWFKDHMNRPGQVWLAPIGICGHILAIALSFLIPWFVLPDSPPIPAINIPAYNEAQSLPNEWIEVETCGYIVPVPATNSYAEEPNKDGTTFLRYVEKNGTNLVRFTTINGGKLASMYQITKPIMLTKSLNDYYREIFVKTHSFHARLFRFKSTHQYYSFYTRDNTDYLIELVETDTDTPLITVTLEDKQSENVYEIVLRALAPWPLEERIQLISRIRKAEPSHSE